MSGDFLSRWSRRKLAEREDAVEPWVPDAAESPASVPEAVVEAPPSDEITPEEIAALPPVETLDAASDIAAFLRKGVPMVLRNAALRRVWAADPAIRDFIGEARDYDWNWNVPGGVPVSGPLSPDTDVAAMVRKALGERHPEPGTVTAQPEASLRPPEPVRQPAPAEVERPEAPEQQPPPALNTGPDQHQAEEADSAVDAVSDTPSRSDEPARPRRHGGALPA